MIGAGPDFPKSLNEGVYLNRDPTRTYGIFRDAGRSRGFAGKTVVC